MSPVVVSLQVGLTILLWFRTSNALSRKRWHRLYAACLPTRHELWSKLAYPIGTRGLEQKLRHAGLNPAEQQAWMGKRSARAMTMLAASAFLAAVLALPLPGLAYALAVLLALISPDIQLHVALRSRSTQIRRHFPHFLDLLATCAGAGHSLYTSMEIVAPRLGGALGDVLRQALLQARAGKRLTEVWDDLSWCTGIGEFRTFSSVLLEAEILGSPIAHTLRTMSMAARAERSNLLRSKVEALPLKLSLCTVLFFLPPIIIVLVLPHLLAFLGSNW